MIPPSLRGPGSMVTPNHPLRLSNPVENLMMNRRPSEQNPVGAVHLSQGVECSRIASFGQVRFVEDPDAPFALDKFALETKSVGLVRNDVDIILSCPRFRVFGKVIQVEIIQPSRCKSY